VKQEDSPKRNDEQTSFFYGYVIVFACFIIMVLAFGVNYSFGIFFKPLLAQFDWTRAATSAAYSLMTLVSGFLGIFAGRLSDAFGPKIIGILSGVFLSSGLLLLSQTQNLFHFYLFYGVLIAAGIGGCWPGLLPAVAKWFVKRRGLMTGIVTSGIGFGTLTIPPLAEWLISMYTWRTSYIVIGILTLVIVISVSLFLKADPREAGSLPFGGNDVVKKDEHLPLGGFKFQEALRTHHFWLLGSIYFGYGYCLHTIMVHLSPHVQDMGFTSTDAALVLALIGLPNTIARIIVGISSDRFGVKPTLIVVLLIMLISLLWIQVARGLGMLYLFAVIFGIGSGGIIALQALAIAESFGLRSLGVILGTITFIYTTGGATGALFSGFIFDLMGSYSPAFWITVVFALISIILTQLLKRPPSTLEPVN
jgi:MFS family permease